MQIVDMAILVSSTKARDHKNIISCIRYFSVNLEHAQFKKGNEDKSGLTTLEAVPPGQHPSNINPTESDGGSPKILLISAPNNGIMAYCAKHPKSI